MLDDPQTMAEFIVTLTTLPFIIIIGIVIYVFARKATASKRWPVTMGKVLTSEVTSHVSSDSNGMHTTIYDPVVVYEYNAGGQSFKSEQVSYGAVGGTSGGGFAEGIVGKYPVGSQVQVSYNPSNPSEAVLEHSGAAGNSCLMFIFIPIELLLLGLLVAAWTGQLK